MFGEPRSNPLEFDKKTLKTTCKVITGNTPPRAIDEYYGDYVEWIKTDNIVDGTLHPTKAVEKLSQKGMEIGRVVNRDSILMACIAGSIAIMLLCIWIWENILVVRPFHIYILRIIKRKNYFCQKYVSNGEFHVYCSE